MSMLRNPEVKKSILIYIIITVLGTTVGFLMSDVRYVLSILVICTVFAAVDLIATYKRYKKISDLTLKIDGILHGNENMDIEEYREGDLSVLACEIQKMTVRMREQASLLQKDKEYLADSMADISHQLKTPLTSMEIILELLKNEDIDHDRRMGLTRELERLVEHIDALVSALLKLSKLDAKTVRFMSERVNLKDVLLAAAGDIAIPLELKEQTLSIIAGGEYFMGDADWTREAIGNILKNCMEHTQQGGSISVCCAQNALYSEIIIADNGAGFAESDIPRLFERFYKGKNASKTGIGIGLALARLIITGQNGTIKAENAKGDERGARFIIRFYN